MEGNRHADESGRVIPGEPCAMGVIALRLETRFRDPRFRRLDRLKARHSPACIPVRNFFATTSPAAFERVTPSSLRATESLTWQLCYLPAGKSAIRMRMHSLARS